MRREDIYRHFTLSSELYESVSKWIKDKVKDTHYKDCPISINNIANIGGGQLGVKVDFQVPPMNDYIEENYKINIDELENY